MGKLLAVSQERQARTRMKIMEDEYVRKNRKAKYSKQDKNSGKGTANIQKRIQKEKNRRYRKAGIAYGKKTRRVDSTITARNFFQCSLESRTARGRFRK
jgi:hypothetical protein